MAIPEFIRKAIPDRLRRYLPTREERGKYVGPLSTFAEYHAIGVGFVGAFNPELLAEVAAYGAGSATGKAKRSGHFKDAAKELAYVGIGAAVGLYMRRHME